MADKGGFLKRALEKSRQAAETLKDEYRKGADGDDSPVARIGPTATDALKTWLSKPSAPEPGDDNEPDETGGPLAEPVPDADAVAGLLQKVDWRQVSSSITDSKAAQRMKDLAGQVDWQAAKPTAARIGTALIAAAASGQLGVLQGRSGSLVARTIINETGLADKVADLVSKDRSAPGAAPLRSYIETTSTEADPGAFDANLADLGRALGPGDGPVA